MPNENAKLLKVTAKDVADLQAKLDVARAAQEVIDKIEKSGVSCDGREQECANAIQQANALLEALS